MSYSNNNSSDDIDSLNNNNNIELQQLKINKKSFRNNYKKKTRKLIHFISHKSKKLTNNNNNNKYNSIFTIYNFILSIIIFILLYFAYHGAHDKFNSSNKSLLLTINKINDNFINKKKFTKSVTFKNDLTNLNLHDYFIKDFDLNISPITYKLIHQKYNKYTAKGFISNLQLPENDFNYGSFETEEYLKFSQKDYSTSLAAKLNIADSSIQCSELQYENDIFYSNDRPLISNEMSIVRKFLVSKSDLLSNFIINDNEKTMSKDEILKTHWYEFGTSSVWLEKEQCYITVSRIIFSARSSRSSPDISLIRARAFDKDWNELLGKSFPRIGIERPDDLEEKLNEIDSKFGSASECYDHPINSENYFDCISKLSEKIQSGERNKRNLLDNYYITYPTVYKFPIDPAGRLKGSEDPRIILKKKGDHEEPIVVFNMENGHGRRMFAISPHRAVDNFVKFVLDEDHDTQQKNWSPFFTEDDINTLSTVSSGTIHFIRNFQPFEVVRCSLIDGKCTILTSEDPEEISKLPHILRGGTQFVNLPLPIPKVQGKEIWVAFIKSHIEHCGCGERFYRPMLAILIKDNNFFNIEFMTPSFDLDTEVLGWNVDQKNTKCDRYNVMSPNSIAAWDVIGQDPKTNRFEDYLVFLYSEADITSKYVTIKGLLDYILNIYREKNVAEDFLQSSDNGFLFSNMVKCVFEDAKEVCAKYGKLHPT